MFWFFCILSLPNSPKKKFSISFYLFGILDFGILFVRVIMKIVNFVLVCGGNSNMSITQSKQYCQSFQVKLSFC